MSEYKFISNDDAERVLSDRLISSSINKFAYFITGWTIRLIGSTGPEYTLKASEIQLSDSKSWRRGFAELPINLIDTNEPEDVLTGAAILSVTNRWPVQKVSINQKADLLIRFENEVEIIVRGLVDVVDWTWQVDADDGTNIVFCDTGELSTELSF